MVACVADACWEVIGAWKNGTREGETREERERVSIARPVFLLEKRLLPRVIVCHFLYWWHPMPIKFKLVRKLFRWTLQNCLLHKAASWLLSTINLAQLVLKAQVEADVDPMVQASPSCFCYRFLSCKIKRTDSIIIYASSLAKVLVLQR